MHSFMIAVVAFLCIFGGTLIGMFLRNLLPEHHLSEESKDAVKLGTGMIATLAALVLGLLIASAKGTFDTMNSELKQVGSKVVLLDRVMGQYGPETAEARVILRHSLSTTIRRVWPEESAQMNLEASKYTGNLIEVLQDRLMQLSPKTDTQRLLQTRALQVSGDIAEGRWLMTEQVGQSSLPVAFLVTLICWLALIFASFGLFSPRNGTVIMAMLICALSAAAALFLMLELDQPYQGFIKISSAPLHNALSLLGK